MEHLLRKRLGIWLIALACLGAFLLFRGDLREVGLWLSVEAEPLTRQLGFSLSRLAQTLLLGTLLGVSVGLGLRSKRGEGWLTPWVLGFLSLPWVPLIIVLNLLAGLTETATIWVGALAAAPHIAYALRPLSTAQGARVGFLKAYRLAFAAIALAEILGRNTGVGSQLRFFFLFWNPPRFLAYAALLALLWLAVEGFTRLILWTFRRFAQRPVHRTL